MGCDCEYIIRRNYPEVLGGVGGRRCKYCVNCGPFGNGFQSRSEKIYEMDEAGISSTPHLFARFTAQSTARRDPDNCTILWRCTLYSSRVLTLYTPRQNVNVARDVTRHAWIRKQYNSHLFRCLMNNTHITNIVDSHNIVPEQLLTSPL